jgi:maltose alpha-D-glucosyltransferase/alpha-amylase
MNDSRWYQDAVFYQLHVRSFCDTVGDGIGDFGGLIEKLDYLQDLGVTTLWLMPFYPSPLRDDGYDIADYETINPQYGTLDQFRQFLRAAHDRDLKVVTELVINHTSDQHAWFQRARRAPPGSPEREFYVWSDTPDKYRDARIIFKDFETSNWTYDHVAKAYYWHRFYAHQPDLNYDNPAVWKAIFPLLDYWFEMGVDGLRLDAIPYLYEREGTNCENLPETHAFLKALRRHVDERFPNRMLLAEANQWPEDAVEYFGDGDECHMAFHFPVMPRLFMAIHREDRFPIVDIMDQTPAIPDGCHWMMFLRNHDELTLEMVTDEERDYMYRAYATDSRARINLGIRRRLAPLLSNNRRRIELMNGLLFSLPGTPVIYYGDEIGMGDNIYLGDRNGVRTPMQWSADRNAGFSRANPQKLFLPIIIDPEYHYESINVEAQQSNPHSLLWWMKRLIDMRRRWPALSRGSLHFLQPENRRVLAFIRKLEGDSVLVVANLSRFVQYVELDLSAYAGQFPIELFGGTRLPAIGKAPYFLTLGPHTFLWFQLSAEGMPAPCLPAAGDLTQLPRLPAQELAELWTEDAFEHALAGYLSCQLYPALGEGGIRVLHVRDAAPLPAGRDAALALVQAELSSGDSELVALPLVASAGADAAEIAQSQGPAPIARLDGPQGGVLYDGAGDPQFAAALLDLVENSQRLPTRAGGEVAGWNLAPLWTEKPAEPPAPTLVRGSLPAALWNFGNRVVLKLLRKIEEGPHPDVEIGRFLSRGKLPAPVAPLLGAIEHRTRRGTTALAVVQQFVPNEGDAWRYALDSLSDFIERAVTSQSAVAPSPPADWFSDEAATPQPADELIGEFLHSARLLGHRTAELHLALAADADDPHFAPEPYTPLYQRSIYQSLRGQAVATFDELSRQAARLPEPLRPSAQSLLALRPTVLERLRRLLDGRIVAMRIRCHGDFALNQLLFTGKDFIVSEFVGNLAGPLSDRRIKRSPLLDVAAMLWSLDLAARAALAAIPTGSGSAPGAIRPIDLAAVSQWQHYWTGRVSAVFLSAYRHHPGIETILPPTLDDFRLILEFLQLERSLQGLSHQLRAPTDMLAICLQSAIDAAGK